MTDYTKLVAALRKVADYINCYDCDMWGLGECDTERKSCVLHNAADAIEALQAQLLKRGEIVRCKKCIHFTQGGWCDREFDWFTVDENDFCSMAEKVEVQDERFDKA